MERNSQVFEGLRPEGRLITMAIAKEAIRVDPLLALDRQLSVVGSQQSSRADMVEILELAAAGKVVPRLERYKLEDVNRVMERLVDNRVRYRAVLMHGE
jgi:propanol-preferring alcohol dehydrogenase